MNGNRKNIILELENRRKIYNYILTKTGLHFNEIVRGLQIPKTTLDYHLNYLKKHDMLKTKIDRRYIRYFISGKVGRNEKEILNIFRDSVPLFLVLYLYAYSERSRLVMSKDLVRPLSTVAYHLNKLVNKEIVTLQKEGKKKLYKLANPQEMYDLLIKYENSLFNDITLADAMTWLQYTSPGKKSKKDSKRRKLSTEEFEEVFYDIFPHPYHV